MKEQKDMKQDFDHLLTRQWVEEEFVPSSAERNTVIQKIKIHTLDYVIAQRDRAGKAFLHDHISDRMIERQVIDFINLYMIFRVHIRELPDF